MRGEKKGKGQGTRGNDKRGRRARIGEKEVTNEGNGATTWKRQRDNKTNWQRDRGMRGEEKGSDE